MSVLLDIPYQPDGRALLSLFDGVRPRAKARALCVCLDADEKADKDGVYEDMFLRIGNLLGGTGESGLVGALKFRLDKIEADIVEEAEPRLYHRGRGKNDPDQFSSDQLEDQIVYELDAACRKFVTAARAIMAEFGK